MTTGPDTPQKIVDDVVAAVQARMMMGSEYDDPSAANEAIAAAPARIQKLVNRARKEAKIGTPADLKRLRRKDRNRGENSRGG